MEKEGAASMEAASHQIMQGAVRLRPERTDDEEFLLHLYLSVRWPELQAVDWTDEAKCSFLASQFQIQTEQYRRCNPEMKRWIVENDAGPMGRLYWWITEAEMHIVDISLLAAWRGHGIGSALLEWAQQVARSAEKPLRLHVEQHNPALRFYRRLGFQTIDATSLYWLLEYPFGVTLQAHVEA
jgi:GNAT superfamily N-acetyltransferase